MINRLEKGGKTMSESKRDGLRVTAFVCLALGVMLFLLEARSTGEAPETFKLLLSSNPLAIVGAALAILAVAALVALSLWEQKRHLKHM